MRCILCESYACESYMPVRYTPVRDAHLYVVGWYQKPRPREATSAVSLGIDHLPGLSTSFHTVPESSTTYLNANNEGDGE
jgi:hypothetical protein